MKTITCEEIFLSRDNPFEFHDNTFYGHERFFEHNHEYYEFILMLSGTLKHKLNGKQMLLPERSLCLINPEDAHSLSNPSGSIPVHLVNFAFTKELFEMTAPQVLSGLDYNPREGRNIICSMLEKEWMILHSKAETLLNLKFGQSKTMRSAFFKNLLSDVLLAFARRDSGNPGMPPQWLESACEQMRIKENYCAGMKKFVTLSGKSKEHLSRSMRMHYNTTPQKYITRLRLNEAARLLRNSQSSLLEIMLDSGFNNDSYFRRCFKRQHGCTPGRYASTCRKIFN